MPVPLAPRQAAVLEFLRDYITNHGYAPSHREICERFDIVSPNGVAGHLRALEAKGFIRRVRKTARAIIVVE